jgi:hypothetical protein
MWYCLASIKLSRESQPNLDWQGAKKQAACFSMMKFAGN